MQLHHVLLICCTHAGVDCDTLLFNFGYYTFSVYWRNSAHDTLLYCLGDSVQELIQNLNALHHHLSSKYDKMIAPAFTCNSVPEGLLVHYHSARPGLGEYVRGIITGLANHMYRLNVNVDILEHETVSASATKHYYKLRITLNGVKDEITLSSMLHLHAIIFLSYLIVWIFPPCMLQYIIIDV